MNTGRWPHEFDYTHGVYDYSDELREDIGGAEALLNCEFNGGEEVVSNSHWQSLSTILDGLPVQKAPRKSEPKEKNDIHEAAAAALLAEFPFLQHDQGFMAAFPDIVPDPVPDPPVRRKRRTMEPTEEEEEETALEQEDLEETGDQVRVMTADWAAMVDETAEDGFRTYPPGKGPKGRKGNSTKTRSMAAGDGARDMAKWLRKPASFNAAWHKYPESALRILHAAWVNSMNNAYYVYYDCYEKEIEADELRFLAKAAYDEPAEFTALANDPSTSAMVMKRIVQIRNLMEESTENDDEESEDEDDEEE